MNTTDKPNISVILPVYSGMDYLQLSVESVLNQEAEGFNFEFLICDDCSKDESYAYLKTIKDPRVKLYKNERNKGLFPTLNFLLEKASAALVHLWAQDDIMLKHCLRETLKFHKQFPNVNFSFSRLQPIDSNGQLLKTPNTFEHKTLSVQDHALSSILYGSIAGNIANVCVVKEAICKIGYFDASMIYVGDFMMWCVLSKDRPIGMNGQILVHIRVHEGQFSRNIDASYHRLKENYEVYQCFLGTLDDKFKRSALMALKWKIYPTYFNQYIYILRCKRFDLASKYYQALQEYDAILPLAMRWFVMRLLKLLALDQKFYNFKFIKDIEKIQTKFKLSSK